MGKQLHIISFDIPCPVDFGGVTDVLHTIRALHAAGIQVKLHCFDCGNRKSSTLEQYCREVHYYSRITGHKCVSADLPFIVSSRSSPELLNNLLQDDHPILVQGIHGTYLLHDERFANRRIIVRLFNAPHSYYDNLCKHTSFTAPLKKWYYRHESKMLQQYEKKILNKALFLSLSQQDVAQFRQLGARHIAYLPPLLPYEEFNGPEGTGCYCLYHGGNLSDGENENAVIWLIRKVFNDLSVPLLIAGKNPSRRLERIAAGHANACLVMNPSEQELHDMMHKAQINILFSLSCGSIKLKLLTTLFNGRYCLANKAAVQHTGLEATCHIGYDAEEFKVLINQLFHQPFGPAETAIRKKLLQPYTNPEQHCKELISYIWDDAVVNVE